MNLAELLNAVFPASEKHLRPTTEQMSLLGHASGPAWVLAGPGTGKTQSLALLVLRLIYVDNDSVQERRVDPESIVVATFTETAAINLQDRISHFQRRVLAAAPDLSSIDTSKLLIGTIDALANDVLQDKRAEEYSNVRLMDDFEQHLFVYENSGAVGASASPSEHQFWTRFEYLFEPRIWQSSRMYGGIPSLPAKWARVSALTKLFDRIAADRVDISSLRSAGKELNTLADLYEEYQAALKTHHRCDFAHLQVRFDRFLSSPAGMAFLAGSKTGESPIDWVLVDEYQDTNPIQEKIYLTLASRASHNLVVVGDDDQALYRFRGASVDCMVNFDKACKAAFGLAAVKQYPLSGNFRSHRQIIEFCDQFIGAFDEMKVPGARAPGKKPLKHVSSVSGAYTAVGTLAARKVDDVARRFAGAVKDLCDFGIVSDPSQCCLLLTSTKETQRNALPYVRALNAVGMRTYNPRSKAYLEQEEVQCLLGSMLALLDPLRESAPENPRELSEFVANCFDAFDSMDSDTEVKQYVDLCVMNMAQHADEWLPTTLQELVYLVLSREPFRAWLEEPIRRRRLGRITSLFESYVAMPVPGHLEYSRGNLKASHGNGGGITANWSRFFYHRFMGYLAKAGLDEEDLDDIIVPLGHVPVMTIHQAKGLEFPFVFVGQLNKESRVSDTHILEREFHPHAVTSYGRETTFDNEMRARLDMIRQFYVAYSRAEWALILVGLDAHFKSGRIPCGPTRNWLTKRVLPL